MKYFSGGLLNNGIPLRIVTGFLGSGKTTLINAVLAGRSGQKLGLIVNDFRPIAVDSALLAAASNGTPASRIEIRELNNGQLFCSCFVGSFIDAVDSFAVSGLDALWVEASGLAKPAPLLDTMAEIEKRSGDTFDFRGMVCVVDAFRFFLLASVVDAIEGQVAYSRYVVVNKADLVSDAELERVVEALRSIKPGSEILTTTRAVLPRGALESGSREAQIKLRDPAYAGWGERGRPIAFGLSGEGAVDEAGLRAFLVQKNQSWQVTPSAFAFHPLLRYAAGARRWDYGVVARPPIRGRRDGEGVGRLECLDDAENLVEVAPEAQRMIDDGPDDALRIDDKDGADRARWSVPSLRGWPASIKGGSSPSRSIPKRSKTLRGNTTSPASRPSCFSTRARS